MVSTTMHLMPGAPIMRSKDMQHWETVSYVFPRIEDGDRYDLIGETTYGKGCMQAVVSLPTGGALKYTTNLFNAPTSPNFDGIGISPDITVELDSTLSQKNYFEISDSEDNQIKGAYNALKNNK